jgi:hypothetical protein
MVAGLSSDVCYGYLDMLAWSLILLSTSLLYICGFHF